MRKLSLTRIVGATLCICMLFSYAQCAFALFGTSKQSPLKQAEDNIADSLMESLLCQGVATENGEVAAIPDDTEVEAIVVLTGAPLYAFDGISESTKDAKDVLSAIEYQQHKVLSEIQTKVMTDSDISLRYTYNRVLNGFSMTVPYGKLAEINKLDGVKYAYVSGMYETAEYQGDAQGTTPPDWGTNVNTTDYKGEGMVIAILDTGLQLDHPLFAGGIDSPKYTKSDIQSFIDAGDLISVQSVPDLTSDTAYYSEKIAYQFDYANRDCDATHDGDSYHGTHVAGIAAGNDGVESGVDSVAPEAQLMIMKVFKYVSGGEGAYDSDIFAALDDCARLGVDVVNMSLGSTCGFSSTFGYENFDIVLANCQNAGIVLSVSAGNESTIAESNLLFGSMYATNPDYGTAGSPGTFLASLSVASCTYDREMSPFSSWGPTPDLVLKPEITAFGSHVYSSLPGSSYGSLNGTSMAAPHVAGAIAAVKQHLEGIYTDMSAYDLQQLAITLLMNTADRLFKRSNNIDYSPRTQGAGYISIDDAVNTPAYITVDNSARPVIDQFDDIERTGAYEFSFTLHNLTNEDISYTLDITALTESVSTMVVYANKNMEAEILDTISYQLSPYVYTDYENNTILLPAGGTFDATIKMQLSRSDLAYMEQHFSQCGMYIDGFIEVYASSENATDMSIPFLGFYGDWTEPASIDRGTYSDLLNNDINLSNQYTTSLYTINYSALMYLGQNPYHEDAGHNPIRNAISPNADGRAENLKELHLSLLRNAKTLTYSISSGDTEYYHRDMEYIEKTYYYNYYVGMLYAGYMDTTMLEPWHGTDETGSVLPNNTEANFHIETTLDFDLHEQNNERNTLDFPVTIDLERPEITDVRTVMSNGKTYIFITATDNQFVADITISDKAFTTCYSSNAVAEDERNAEKTYCYDITGFDVTLGLTISDYACNQTSYTVNTRDCLDSARPNETNSVIFEDFENTTNLSDSIFTLESENELETWRWQNYNNNFAYIDSNMGAQNEWLILDALDAAEYENELRLSYSFMANTNIQDVNAEFAVYVRNDLLYQNTWAKIFSTRNQLAFMGGQWNDVRVMIPAKYQAQGSMQLAFCFTTDEGTAGGSDFSLDNISLFDTGNALSEVAQFDTTQEPDAFTVSDALNIPGGTVEFENDDEYPWEFVNDGGRSYVRSTNFGMSISTSEITINKHIDEAGTTLTFDWRASSEAGWDIFTMWVNGERAMQVSGEVDWKTNVYTFTAPGDYRICFSYAKDQSVDGNDDCGMLDKLFFTYPVVVSEVLLDQSAITIEKYSCYRLNAVILPQDATPNTLTYESSDANVASVDSTGLVHAMNVGTAIITATAINGISASIEVTVIFENTVPVGYALVAFIAEDVYENGTGYKLSFDSDATAYGTHIPEFGPIMQAESEFNAEFEYTLPTAEQVVLCDGICYAVMPAGTYDYAITNASNDRLWTVDGEMSRGDDYVLEAGEMYIFTVTSNEDTDIAIRDAQPATEIARGDANCDGTVNTGDAVYVLSNSVGLISLTEHQILVADMNDDGVINTADAILVLRVVTEIG